MFRFRVSRLVAGKGVRVKVGRELSRAGVKRALLITGVNTGKTAFCRDVVECMENEGIELSIWDGVRNEPDEATVNAGYSFAREKDVDAIVAFGGGSVMDTAKLVNLCLALKGRLEQVVNSIPPALTLKPMFAVPTTFGTGSETTCAAVVKINGVKRGILHESLLPDFAFVDWEIKAPKSVAASAGMDAVMHAFEAYTCISSDKIEGGIYSGSSEVTDTLALKALKMLRHLPEYVNNGSKAREIALGSNMAGMAFGNAGVHFGHAASYAISAKCDAPHGVCVASVGQALLEWLKNLDEVRDKAEDVESIVNINELRREVGLPSLSELGIGREDVEFLVEKTMEVKRLIAMRPEIGRKDAGEIFMSALEY